MAAEMQEKLPVCGETDSTWLRIRIGRVSEVTSIPIGFDVCHEGMADCVRLTEPLWWHSGSYGTMTFGRMKHYERWACWRECGVGNLPGEVGCRGLIKDAEEESGRCGIEAAH